MDKRVTVANVESSYGRIPECDMSLTGAWLSAIQPDAVQIASVRQVQVDSRGEAAGARRNGSSWWEKQQRAAKTRCRSFLLNSNRSRAVASEDVG